MRKIRFLAISPVILLGVFYLAAAISILADPRTPIGDFFGRGEKGAEITSVGIGLVGFVLGLWMLLYKNHAVQWYTWVSMPSLIYNGVTAGLIIYLNSHGEAPETAMPLVMSVVSIGVLALGLQNIDLAGDLQAREAALAAKDKEIEALKAQIVQVEKA